MRIIEPVELVASATSTWENVDLTAVFGTDAGLVAGVQVFVGATSSNRDVGLKHPDSVQGPLDIATANSSNYYAAVNAQNELALYTSHLSTKIWITGYWLTSEATFPVEPIDVGIGILTPWVAIDLSPQVGTDAALCALIHYRPGSSSHMTLQGGDDTLNESMYKSGNASFGSIIGINDANEIQVQGNDAGNVWTLVGWINDNYVGNIATPEISMSVVDAWETLDLSAHIPAEAVAIAYRAETNATSTTRFGIRDPEHSTFEEALHGVDRGIEGAVGVTAQEVQTYQDSSNELLHLRGYFLDSSIPTPAITNGPFNVEPGDSITINIENKSGALSIQNLQYGGMDIIPVSEDATSVTLIVPDPFDNGFGFNVAQAITFTEDGEDLTVNNVMALPSSMSMMTISGYADDIGSVVQTTSFEVQDGMKVLIDNRNDLSNLTVDVQGIVRSDQLGTLYVRLFDPTKTSVGPDGSWTVERTVVLTTSILPKDPVSKLIEPNTLLMSLAANAYSPVFTSRKG